MARPKKWPPPIRQRNGQDTCLIWIGGRRRHVTLGPTGSQQARAEYARLLAEADVSGGQILPRGPAVLVAEVVAAYLEWAQQYHERRQYHRCRQALEPVARLYGHTPAAELGPVALEACRAEYVRKGHVRQYCNCLASCVRTVWRWAAAREMVPAATAAGLAMALPLRRRRTEAPERQRVHPADPDAVARTLPALPRIVADLVRVIQLTGARPGEICAMRPMDLDQGWRRIGDQEMWLYKLDEHKNDWRGGLRWIPLGPQAQEILRPYLDRPPETYCFSPREVVEEYDRAAGQDSLSARRARPVGDRYSTDTLDFVVRRARRRVGAPRWCPNQLRHALATRLEVELGREDARCVMGHNTPSTTAIYAESVERAAQVMARLG